MIRLEVNDTTCGSPATGSIAHVGQASVSQAFDCADRPVNKTVSPSAVRPGSPVTFTITVANSIASGVDGAGTVITDPLPSGFIHGSSTCAVTSGEATCGAVDFAAGTRTVTSTITSLPPGAAVRLTIVGTGAPSPARSPTPRR